MKLSIKQRLFKLLFRKELDKFIKTFTARAVIDDMMLVKMGEEKTKEFIKQHIYNDLAQSLIKAVIKEGLIEFKREDDIEKCKVIVTGKIKIYSKPKE